MLELLSEPLFLFLIVIAPLGIFSGVALIIMEKKQKKSN